MSNYNKEFKNKVKKRNPPHILPGIVSQNILCNTLSTLSHLYDKFPFYTHNASLSRADNTRVQPPGGALDLIILDGTCHT